MADPPTPHRFDPPPLENVVTRPARALAKIWLVVLASAVSIVFFGVLVPFFLLAFRVLPSRGIGGVIYLGIGALCGLVFGATTTAVSLARSRTLVSRYYVVYLATLLVLSAAWAVCYYTMYDRFRGI